MNTRKTIQTYIDCDRDVYRKLGAIARLTDTTIGRLLGDAATKIVDEYEGKSTDENKSSLPP